MNSKKYPFRAIALASMLLSLGASLDAASLGGIVSDESSGSALEGATVTIPELDLRTSTNRRGYFEFQGIEPGTYAVQVSYLGAQPKTAEAQVSEAGAELLKLGLNLNVFELTDFSVSSYQSATARALNMQRVSENLRDIVASDHFGQFADSNAAEALNRLPGVSVERDQGEGRFVVIRGINPDLNSVALDGVALASPSADERSTLLDTIPIEVLNTLEVTKAVTPDQPGDAIGGYINLRSPSAFDYDKRTIRLSGAMLYSDLVDKTGYRINAFYADTFGKDNQWGFVLTAVNSERSFGSDNVEASDWFLESGQYVPEVIEYRDYDLVRERSGVTANLEFQPKRDSLFFFRTSYNSYEDTETRDLSLIEFDDGAFGGVTAGGFTNTDATSIIEYKDRTEEMSIFVMSLGGEHVFKDWSVDYTFAFSQAKEDTGFDREAVFEANGSSTTSVTGINGYLPRLGPATAGVDFSDPAVYDLDEIIDANQLAKETDLSAKLDLKREFKSDGLKYIKFGGLVRNKEKENDAEEFEFDAIDDTFANFPGGSRRNFLNRPTPSLGRSFLSTGNLDLASRDRSIEDSVVGDYDTTENVFAAYLMGSLGFGKWDVILGARVEHTDFETKGFEFLDDGSDTVTPTKFSKDYTNFLPGIHLRRDVGENGVFRASWTNTFARPTFEQSNPGSVRDGTDVERGNPDLDPYESMNLDASFQYYSEDYGVFSVAVFYKDIENFIYEQEFTDGPDDVVSFRNGDDGKILGLELSYAKQFTSLPGALAGLSFSSNLTLTDSEANAERESSGPVKTSFLKQSDLIGNVSLAWEWDRYFIRLSGTFRDDYLDSLGDDAAGLEDEYIDDFFQVDLYGSVRVYKGLSIFAEVNNITDEPLRAYFGGSNRLSQYEEYGVSGAIGAKWNF